MWPMLIPLLGDILKRVLPDPQMAEDAKLKLVDLAQRGELANLDADLKVALGQLAVNQAEAATGNVFIGGWRPFIGWACGVGLAYAFLLYPLLTWAAALWQPGFAPPALVVDHLMELVIAMLGMAGLRSWEKFKGVARP